MSHLLVAREGRLLRLTLNRPEKRNALHSTLCRDLVDTIESAAADPEIGAILLLANGKSFCAGMDLSEVATGAIDDLHERLFTIGSRLATPIVAAIHGAALGGGTGLVANCHIAIANRDATFGLTEIRLGLWPFLIYRACSAAMGDRRTLELALSGRTFLAAEARALCLVHEVADDPAGRAREIALQIASRNPTAIRKGMDFVHESIGITRDAAGILARRVRQEVFDSPDFRKAIAAFREKRPKEES